MARKIDLRVTCLAGPKCRDMTPVAGIISLLLNHGQLPPKPAQWKVFEACKDSRQLHVAVRHWCVETARGQSKHALIVGFPHTDEHWDVLSEEFPEYSVVWFGAGKPTTRPAMTITEPAKLEDVIRLTLNHLPVKPEDRAQLMTKFRAEGKEKHPARQALESVLASRGTNPLARIAAG